MNVVGVSKQNEFIGHSDAVFSILWDSKKKILYSGSGDGLIAKWDVKNSSDGKSICRVGKPVWSFLIQENTLVAGTSFGNLHIINLDTNLEVRNMKAHNGGVFSIANLADSFLSGGADGNLILWNNKWEKLGEVKVSEKSIRDIQVVNETEKLVISCSDNNIYVVDFELNAIATLKGHTNSVFSSCYNPRTREMYSGGRDALLNIWDSDFNHKKSINAHWYHIHWVSISPDYRLFATCSMDKTIKIWDSSNYELLKVIDFEKFKSHTNCINKVLWISPNELISCSDDRKIMHFKLDIQYDTQ